MADPLDHDVRETLLRTHAECTFRWSARDGWPLAGRLPPEARGAAKSSDTVRLARELARRGLG